MVIVKGSVTVSLNQGNMRKTLTTLFPFGSRAILPLWLKLVALLYLCGFVSYGWKNYGLQYFLWFSCLGVIGTVLALWLENRLLASMMLLSTFIADEIGWGGDFFFRLIFGWHPYNATNYMFDHRLSLYGRAISLYHLYIPILLVWMVFKLRYDKRAIVTQTLYAMLVLFLSFTVTNPASNINWVFGVGPQPQTYVPAWLYLVGEMVFIPVVFYLPMHLLLMKLGWHRPKDATEFVEPAARSG
jgi:hypothetical protein